MYSMEGTMLEYMGMVVMYGPKNMVQVTTVPFAPTSRNIFEIEWKL